jgi:aldose 1-epimerase
MTRAGCLVSLAFLLLTLPIKASVKTEEWGRTSSDRPVKLFTLSDAQIRVRLIEYGARIVSIDAPDRRGRTADVVLGHNNLAAYLADPKGYFGAIVGRYGNRIAKGTFTLAGTTFHIPLNDNSNALHGGPGGFSTKVWRGHSIGTNTVEFTLVSPDGDMGFPGALTVHVFYTLDSDKLDIRYEASTSKPTVLNLTNHSFFNLSGEASGAILTQELRIDADRITPVAAGLIPIGTLDPVRGTPFDFTHLTPIGQRIHSENNQLKLAGGYDDNYVLNGQPGTLREAAYVLDPASGRTLAVFTTEPGLQFYSGNLLHGSVTGFSGKTYQKYAGFCLETQHFPDSPNHPNFPGTTLEPGHPYHSETVFVFGTAPLPGQSRPSQSHAQVAAAYHQQ